MSINFRDVEKLASALSPREKAAVARKLIGELDGNVDANAGQLWVDEAERRFEAYLKGELEALPGDEVMMRVRNRLKERTTNTNK